jgi:hypothetical protein
MKKFLFALFVLSALLLLVACYPSPEKVHSNFANSLATAAASPVKEYTFIVNGVEKKVCGYFTYEDWSPFGSTYYVGWSDGNFIAQFPVAPTTVFSRPDCKN